MSQKYPIGIETFADIIEGGYAYVDKTELMYRLIDSGKYFFLSRPRRFGKSLMLSTMEAYFEGRRNLFKGLWIDRDDIDWTPRPVFRFNFVTASANIQSLRSTLINHISKWEDKYGKTDTQLSIEHRFYNLIEAAYHATGRKAVVLIDEYDKVLVNSMHDPELHSEMKSILKPVFSVLKGADSFIEFGILTGISRFSKLNIFSDLNNLADISLDDRFSSLCGFTIDELSLYFREGIDEFSIKENLDSDEMIQKLKENYDGYHFSANCPDIFNPFSLLNALDRKVIVHSWFESGTPSFLVERIKNADEDLREVLRPLSSGLDLASSCFADSDLTNILYQTGYLTIKDYNREYDEYTLGIPNKEVASGLYRSLLPLYSGMDASANTTALSKMRRAILAGETESFLSILRSFLAAVPYDLSEGRHEIYFENNIYLIFKLLGLNAQTEYKTAQGRIDILIETPQYIYIIELKLGASAEEALLQISQKNYDLPFDADHRKIIRIGVNIDRTSRTLDRWLIE